MPAQTKNLQHSHQNLLIKKEVKHPLNINIIQQILINKISVKDAAIRQPPFQVNRNIGFVT